MEDVRRMHRVPKLVRFNKHNKEDCYTPKMVSFGPYYHGAPELRMAEELKRQVRRDFVSSRCTELFYDKISQVIDQIRNCYVGVSTDAYDDRALAEMMLLDASFAIYIMEVNLEDIEKCEHSRQYLGIAATPVVTEDLILFENQIPLRVIKLLCDLMHGEHTFYKFLRFFAFKNIRLITRIPVEDEGLPLHLLDASYQLLVKEVDNAGEEPFDRYQWWQWRRGNLNESREYNRQSRSVTNLKAKGIHFKPSSYCLKDIKFKSYIFFGQLQLPVLFFHANSKLIFMQLIAHEMSLKNEYKYTVLCYINFMQSLIVKSEDVKELREKKILFSNLDSDERIVEVIKGIDTHGRETDFIFDEVKTKIEKHCSSKGKTWFAELIHTHFHSPWTFTALLAAIFLLCLTFLQTYYTMNPRK
ncbi:Hypothetical predicted protein [Olea europaea subsp. europaea]|uniref:Uncharacterized protein n=1 Tax=Olea europaea subsp. europaea TaxID=158383 RepID=A0A8S0QHB1_OLEEU|nr:Hypothetical predicted protein [Olea europaea subsp. europaea]